MLYFPLPEVETRSGGWVGWDAVIVEGPPCLDRVVVRVVGLVFQCAARVAEGSVAPGSVRAAQFAGGAIVGRYAASAYRPGSAPAISARAGLLPGAYRVSGGAPGRERPTRVAAAQVPVWLLAVSDGP